MTKYIVTSEYMNIFVGIMFVIFGLIIGSFLNVCILELPGLCKEIDEEGKTEEEIAELKKEKKEKWNVFFRRRSHCMDCGYELKWYDMIPVLSYIVYGGKCRKCHKPISIQYPIIEAANALLYLLIFYVCGGINFHSVIMCLFASALLAIGVIDTRTMEIPVCLNIFIAILGAINVIIFVAQGKISTITPVDIIASISFFIVLLAMYFGSKGTAIGGGDVKLILASFLILGMMNTIIGYFVACIIATIIVMPLKKMKKIDNIFPFGSFLGVAFLITGLFGTQLVHLYLNICKGFLM